MGRGPPCRGSYPRVLSGLLGQLYEVRAFGELGLPATGLLPRACKPEAENASNDLRVVVPAAGKSSAEQLEDCRAAMDTPAMATSMKKWRGRRGEGRHPLMQAAARTRARTHTHTARTRQGGLLAAPLYGRMHGAGSGERGGGAKLRGGRRATGLGSLQPLPWVHMCAAQGVAEFLPHAVILMLGTNDAMHHNLERHGKASRREDPSPGRAPPRVHCALRRFWCCASPRALPICCGEPRSRI